MTKKILIFHSVSSPLYNKQYVIKLNNYAGVSRLEDGSLLPASMIWNNLRNGTQLAIHRVVRLWRSVTVSHIQP